ncbi:MAG: hypothetical protein EOO46_10070 [Flavobacterium sp.]|nr:MAG: hypothetical protein EOO46_10070 [Flavobacterium sp.]
MKKNKKISKIILLSLAGCIIPIVLIIGISMVAYGTNFPLVKFYYWKGFLAQRNGNSESAIKSYDKVTALDPKYPTVYISRGSANLDLDQHNKAISDYTVAIKLAPENEEPYAYRGRAHYEIDSLENAMEDYNKAISLNKDFGYAYSNRALLKYTKLNDWTGGCEDLEKAAQLGDKEAKVYLKDGLCK